jgi:hypothetical protein
MDFSRLDTRRTVFTTLASALLLFSLLFLPWYSLSHDVVRHGSADWICGVNDYKCTGFETFPLMRWLLIAAAFTPLILAWILIRGHRLSWPPGEATMVVGFTAMVLIGYNGIIDRPGSGVQESGVGLTYGYWIALLGTIGISVAGYLRSLESGGRKERKAPGTV